MTVKEFFKSTSFKCIVVLLSILLVCGAFLTIAYGFLEVTAGEKLSRAVTNIYGREVEIYGFDEEGEYALVSTADRNPKGLTSGTVTVGQSDIIEAYKIVYTEDEAEVINYLVQSKGKGGYAGGSVTLWVALFAEESAAGSKITGINKVIISENSGQSFIGNITAGFLNSFAEGFDTFESIEDTYYTVDDGYVVTGTSRSSNAICNAVNGAIEFVDVKVLGHERVDIFEQFVNKELIDTRNTTFTVADGKVKYRVVTIGYGNAKAFTVDITVALVDGKAKIDSLEIIVDGTNNWNEPMADVETAFKDKDLAYFEGLLGDNFGYKTPIVTSGATQSNYNVAYACVFALSNYSAAMGGNA